MARILLIDDEPLLRKRVTMLLEAAHHEVVEAADGQQGLSVLHEKNPDLVLVDFVMPKMNGFQFCQAMRAISNHRETPVVLLSARTDKVGESFIERFAVRDAISKPFEDEGLLAVVENALGDRSPRGEAGPSEGPLSGAFNVDNVDAQKDPLADEAERIAGIICDRLPDIGSRRDEIAAALTEAMGDGVLEEGERDFGGDDPGPALVGDLSAVPLSDVIQLLAMQHQDGLLEVVSKGAAATIQFADGQVEMAVAEGVRAEFLLGRYLVEEDLLSRQDLDLLLASRKGSKLLGEQLVKLGYITPEELAGALGRQTRDIVLEVLRWRTGRCFFHPGRRIEIAAEIANRLDSSMLVLEGLRQVDEWRLFEREIPSFDMIFEPVTGSLFDKTELSSEEGVVLALVDGRASVRDIITETNMGSFGVFGVLYRLVSLNLIRRQDS
jgi:DNA-binding response OmpR family regulator